MKEKADKIPKIRTHRIIFAVFALLTGMTAFVTVLFGDDYYYAYFVKAGGEFFLSENIVHYEQTNGRVLVHLLDELLIGFGLTPWRIFVTVCVAGAALLIARIASDAYSAEALESKKYAKALVFSCGAFASLDIAILRQSVWWATGSLNYLFPAVLLLFLWYNFEKPFKTSGKPALWLPALALLCGMSTEQAAFASLAVCVFYSVKAFLFRSARRFIYPVSLLSALAGFLTLYLAPGNRMRMEYYPEFYSLGLIGQAVRNFSELASVAFGTGGMYSALIAALAAFAAVRARERKFVPASLGALSLALYTAGLTGCLICPDNEFFTVLTVCAALSGFAVLIPDGLIRLIKKGESDFMFYAGALVLQAAMLVSPQFGPRTVLVSALLVSVPAVKNLSDEKCGAAGFAAAAVPFCIVFSLRYTGVVPVFCAAGAAVVGLTLVRKNKLRAKELLGVVCVAVMFVRAAVNYAGYAENYVCHEKNAERVKAFVSGEREGTELNLFYLPNSVYKYTMPYDDTYHMWRYKLLYDIPEDTKIVYTEYED